MLTLPLAAALLLGRQPPAPRRPAPDTTPRSAVPTPRVPSDSAQLAAACRNPAARARGEAPGPPPASDRMPRVIPDTAGYRMPRRAPRDLSGYRMPVSRPPDAPAVGPPDGRTLPCPRDTTRR